ncbi:MAG: hypothetical protein DDT32_01116 [Syntrophomonadaceae bacterium]|nr:hypothetical protein [Bacillota bacterium]
MSKLQRRLQDYRHRQEKILLLQKISWMLVAAFSLSFLSSLPGTYAFFTSRAETGPVSFSAATFEGNLALAPGKCLTNDSPGNPGPAYLVAQLVAGQIYLDFGTYPVGNNRNFPSVLLIDNISTRPLSLHWHFSANLAPFFDSQAAPITVNPGKRIELDFKLDSKPTDLAAEYLGTLHLSALNGFISRELPVRLRLAETGRRRDATVTKQIVREKVDEDDGAATVDEDIYKQLLPLTSPIVTVPAESGVQEDTANQPTVAETVYDGSLYPVETPPASKSVPHSKRATPKDENNGGRDGNDR